MKIQIGQKWAVGKSVYVVSSLNGPDKQYPIELDVVSKDPRIIEDCRGAAEVNFQGDPVKIKAHLDELAAMGMSVEPRWFEKQDVKKLES